MVTRMERYNNSSEDVKIAKRSEKNRDLYEKVRFKDMNPEYIDINKTNVYEINSLNDVTKKRSSYQKLRSLDDVLEKERTISTLEEESLPKEERIYNIDEILKRTKEAKKTEDKKRLLNTEYNILTQLDLDKVASNQGFSKDYYKKLVDDLYVKKESKDDDEKELFADLIEDNNSNKKEQIKEINIEEKVDNSIQEKAENKEIKEIKKEDTSNFITKIEITKEMKMDNEDEKENEEFYEKRNSLLTIIIVLVILLLLAAGYLVMKYFSII